VIALPNYSEGICTIILNKLFLHVCCKRLHVCVCVCVCVANLIIKINREYKVMFVQHTTKAYRESASRVSHILYISSRGRDVSFTPLTMEYLLTTYEVLSKSPRNLSEKSRHTQSPNSHRPLQSSSLGSVHNDPNVSATIGSCPGSPFVSACSAPYAIRPGSPLRCQILAPST
jgi:hypothetical protein